MPTFNETSPRVKLWTQIMKVADINGDKSWNQSFGESRGHKSRKSWTRTILTPSRHVEMFATKSTQVCNKPVCVALMEFSPLQCTRKVGNKARDKFPTKLQTCHGHKSWKSATWFVSRTFMICVSDKSMTLSGTCRRLCRKVGVMEFRLN